MNRFLRIVPGGLLALVIGTLLLWGPIPQPAEYHAFADRREFWGLANAADVLSNAAFAIVAAWGLRRERQDRCPSEPVERHSRRWFLGCLAATAIGSAYYHSSPDNLRLVFDRLPIALACASILSTFHARAHPMPSFWVLPALLLSAAGSVAWWAWTQSRGVDDLRPYLVFQVAPLILVPAWQWASGASTGERRWFGAAIALYVLAKAAEVLDHPLFALATIMSGHTLKHLLAAAAAACIVACLAERRPDRSPIPYASIRHATRNP